MGAGNSKSAPGQDPYVFSADSPVRFSQSMIDSLQNSPETDSTRARNQELLIQSRVTAELEKIRDREAARLAALTEDLSADSPSDSPSPSDSDSSPSLAERAKSAITGGSSDSAKQERSHDSVSKEIASLKAKLEKRKKVEKADKSVEKAKDELVRCLRTNDRRPLDCWEEVERFKGEVARMERRFVERAMR